MFHFQNLNTWIVDGKFIKGSWLKASRFWFRPFGYQNPHICFEWIFKTNSCFAVLSIGGGETNKELSLRLGVPLIGSFYLTFDNLLPYSLVPSKRVKWLLDDSKEYWDMPIEREIGVRVFDWKIWVSLWSNPDEWSSKDPKWWKFVIDPLKFILGDMVHTEREIEKKYNCIVLPEGVYPVKVTHTYHKWKRPRWPFAIEKYVYEINSEEGILAHAGKGTTSYNCEDDSIFSFGFEAESFDHALRLASVSVMKDRDRYGWPHVDESVAKVSLEYWAAVMDVPL